MKYIKFGLLTVTLATTAYIGSTFNNGNAHTSQSEIPVQSVAMSVPDTMETSDQRILPTTADTIAEIPEISFRDDLKPAPEREFLPVSTFPEIEFPAYGFPMTATEAPHIKSKQNSEDFEREFQFNEDPVHIDTFFADVKALEVEGLFCEIELLPGNEPGIHMYVDVKNESVKRVKSSKFVYALKCSLADGVLKLDVKNITHPAKMVFNSTKKFNGKIKLLVAGINSAKLGNKISDISVNGLSMSNCKIDCSFGNVKVKELNSDLEIHSSSGNIDIDGFNGRLECKSLFGKQHFRHMKGDIVSGSSSGDISLSEAEGNCDLKTQFGEIRVDSLKGELKAYTASGNCRIKMAKGEKADVECRFGNIYIENLKSELEIRSGSGSVNLLEVKGNVKINSQFGTQKLENIKGNIISNSGSGDIYISEQRGEMNLHASHGSITLERCNGKMNLKTESGNISGDEIQIESSLEIETGLGNVRMQISNPVSELSYDLESTLGDVKIQKEDLNISKKNGNILIEKGPVKIHSESRSGSQVFR